MWQSPPSVQEDSMVHHESGSHGNEGVVPSREVTCSEGCFISFQVWLERGGLV